MVHHWLWFTGCTRAIPVGLGDEGEQRPLLVSRELHLRQVVDEEVDLCEGGFQALVDHPEAHTAKQNGG